MKYFILLFLSLFTIPTNSISQDQHITDSLEIKLKNEKQDTSKANILYQLSNAYWGNNPDKAMYFAKQNLTLSEQIGFKKGIGNAYNSMGVIYRYKGEYSQALNYHKIALKICESNSDKSGIAFSYLNIGNIYSFQGNFPEALKYFFASLKIYEERGDKLHSAILYNNIGSTFQIQGNQSDALKNLQSALKIEQEISDRKGIAGSYNNIGELYKDKNNYSEALKNYFSALKINQAIGNKSWEAINLDNIGSIYSLQNNYPEALKMSTNALKIYLEIGDKNGIANSYCNIGNLYSKQGKYHEASSYLNKALLLSKEIGNPENLKYCYYYLANLDSMQGNFKSGWEHTKLYYQYRDSLFNEESTKKTVQQQMQYTFDKKESLAKVEQEKKNVMAQKEIQKQKLVRNGFISGFSVVLLFAGVFFTQRNKIKKSKKRSDELLLNILPEEVAEELKTKGSADAKLFDNVTVMFTDFKNFTRISELLSPSELVAEIHSCFKAFDYIIDKHNIEKIKTIGDSYMCVGGLPVANTTNPTDVVNAAMEIQQFMHNHLHQRTKEGKEVFEIRIGLHSGPVVAGIVGVKKFAYDIWGDTVNIASRMESSGEAGKVNISGSTYELVKDKFNCIYRGKIQAKNKGDIDMYFIESRVK